MHGLASVVMPAFNRGFIIREALESILEQTYQDWEALVVNDGSTDDTSEVVKEYTRSECFITCAWANEDANAALFERHIPLLFLGKRLKWQGSKEVLTVSFLDGTHVFPANIFLI